MAAKGQLSLRAALGELPAHVVELDDWKRVTEQADRRRIQNRVNQRAARDRKRASAKQGQLPSQRALKLLSNLVPSSIEIETEPSYVTVKNDGHDDIWQMFYSAMELAPGDRSRLINIVQDSALYSTDMQTTLKSFENRLIGSPGRDCLFTLIQFNVFRAMVKNERDMGLPVACALHDDSISPIFDAGYIAQEMPAPLRPTLLQRKITHHPWIDLLPLPQMRDNLLRAEDTYDETELCTAILGCSPNSDGRTGMIVWGEAWDPTGWEFTEEFIRHWGWTVQGCDGLLAATNYWRQRRGKKVIEFNV